MIKMDFRVLWRWQAICHNLAYLTTEADFHSLPSKIKEHFHYEIALPCIIWETENKNYLSYPKTLEVYSSEITKQKGIVII